MQRVAGKGSEAAHASEKPEEANGPAEVVAGQRVGVCDGVILDSEKEARDGAPENGDRKARRCHGDRIRQAVGKNFEKKSNLLGSQINTFSEFV